MNSIIFEKVSMLNEMSEDLKTNVKLIYVFKDNVSETGLFDNDSKTSLFLVTYDDKVYCSGNNYNGVLGFGHKEGIFHLTINEDLSNKQIIQFNNSYCHTTARNVDGKIYCWGHNESGVLGNAIEDDQIYKPVMNNYLLNERIVDICCGAYHTLVLTQNGEVYSWGSNKEGQIGNDTYGNVLIPFNLVEFIGEKVKVIACGLSHSMVLAESGRVYCWGNNFNGELGIGNKKDSRKPEPIVLGENIIIDKISCGSDHSLLLSLEGDIYVFGCNEYKQLGIKTDEAFQCIPMKLHHSQKFTEVASHPYFNFSSVLSKNNLYHVWGECGKNKIIDEPNVMEFPTLNEFFADSFGITYKTIDKLEEFSKNLFSLKNKKCEKLFGTQISDREIISSGAFGIVCQVSERDKNNFYAVKKIPFSESKKLRVCQEAKILVKTKSPYIVKCFDSWIEDNYYMGNEIISKSKLIASTVKNLIDNDEKTLLLHIQMELCLMSLKDFMKKLNHELDRYSSDIKISSSFSISGEIFLEIIESIDFLHKQKIIHRDIKPSNILVSGEVNGRFIKLGDLGLAVIHESDDQSHSINTGSEKYMAPEVKKPGQKPNRTKYGPKADIFSSGITLKELFGNSKFDSISDNQILSKHSALKDLMNRMTIEEPPDSRPDCREILCLKNSWFLSLNEVIGKKRIIIDRDLNIFPNIDNYHLYFIQRKIKESVEFIELREKDFVIV